MPGGMDDVFNIDMGQKKKKKGKGKQKFIETPYGRFPV